MKALTVMQPWAWAIANGLKTIENRSKPTKHRGPLLIHAGLGLSYMHLFDNRLEEWGVTFPPLEALSFGYLMAVVDLVDCKPLAEVEGERFAVGPWCWILANARPLPLVRAVGKLGLWNYEGELPLETS